MSLKFPEMGTLLEEIYESTNITQLAALIYLRQKHSEECILFTDLQKACKMGEKFGYTHIQLTLEKNYDGELYISYLNDEFNPKDPLDLTGLPDLSKFLLDFKRCLDKPSDPIFDNRFIIFPVYLSTSLSLDIYHANLMIFDKQLNTFELFEPNVDVSYLMRNRYGDNYFQPVIDLFETFFKRRFSLRYPQEYCPIMNFQDLDYLQSTTSKGFCLAWVIWYLDVRLSNPDVPSEDLIRLSISKILDSKETFENFIRRYAKLLSELKEDIENCIN